LIQFADIERPIGRVLSSVEVFRRSECNAGYQLAAIDLVFYAVLYSDEAGMEGDSTLDTEQPHLSGPN
jgi:hypothetical protein